MKYRILISAAATALAGAAMASGISNDGLSRSLLPPGRASVRQVHDLHDREKIGCEVCHTQAGESSWASDRLIPNMKNCGRCHDVAANVTPATPVGPSCRGCHAGLVEGEKPTRGDYPRPNIRFSHKAHKGEARCGACHPAAAQGRSPASGRDMVGMRTCFDCHGKSQGSSECRKCHLVSKDGRMVTEIGGDKLVPPQWLKGPSHGIDWSKKHASMAGSDSEFCGACHSEEQCQRCHAGKRRPRDIHPGDWISSHGVSSRLNSPRCNSCHRAQSFCLECHRRSGAAWDSPEKSRNIGTGGRYHGDVSAEQICRRARQDITSCVSCHSERTCRECHSSLFSPHPPGFVRKCAALASRNRNSCSKCHLDDAWERCK